MLGDRHRERSGGKDLDPRRPAGYWIFISILILIALVAAVAWLFLL